MKRIVKTALVSGIFLTLAACGNDTTEGAKSTPVDSTNMTGAAPVQYTSGDSGIGDNARTTAPMHSLSSGDSIQNRNNYQEPTGQGTNTSNTTDRRTTSGSANNGDADGDIKR